jgi:hypothetical protein
MIKARGVHDRPTEPVDPRPLLRDIPVLAQLLQPPVVAYTVAWQPITRRRRLVAVGYTRELHEPTESARLRHALAHEFGHVFERHDGDIFYLYRDGYDYRCWGLDECVMSFQDRQCEAIAAFVLIPAEALKEYGPEGSEYLARMMDVPPHLVELRWQIWGRFHK